MLNVKRPVGYFNHINFVFIKKINEFFEHIPHNEGLEKGASKIWNSACLFINGYFLFKSRGNQRSSKAKFNIICISASNRHKVFCFPYTQSFIHYHCDT